MREFSPELTSDPLPWVKERLCDLPGLLAGAEIPPSEAGPDDARLMADTASEILSTVDRLLTAVRASESLETPDDDGPAVGARFGWL